MKQLNRLRRLFWLLFLVVASYGLWSPTWKHSRSAPTHPSHSPAVLQSIQQRHLAAYGQMPLGFEVNRGQTASPVNFLARGSGYSLFLTDSEAVLSLRDEGRGLRDEKGAPSAAHPAAPAVLRMKLLGAKRGATVTGAQKLAGVSNYFIGPDPRQWRTGVARYGRVEYQGIYPGVDLVYYGNQRQLEYDFMVAPGADPNQICLGFSGAQGAQVDEKGNLVLRLKDSTVQWHKPVIYQKVNGQRKLVAGRYQLSTLHSGLSTASFRLAAYDHRQPLVIDPVLSYSTYLGGNNADQANAIAVDGGGNAYITGQTASNSFPTLNPLQATGAGNTVAFVTKLDASGALVYSTYLGGSSTDQANGIAVDGAGDAYITGQTTSTDFPVAPANALQTTNAGGQDAFVTQLSANGGALVYSTYLGGSGADGGNGIAVDSGGNAYVTGVTSSTDFLGLSSLLFRGGTDAFVTKLNPTGTATVYATILSGNKADQGNAIAVNAAGEAYVTGSTQSPNFPATAGAVQSNKQNGASNFDAFVVRLNAAGSASIYGTYLGGSGNDNGNGIAVDGAGNAYVTGDTTSTNFPTQNPLQASLAGGTDAFVTVINSSGSALLSSTYLGGAQNDSATAIALDGSGNVHVAGATNSTDFPVKNAMQAAFGGGPNDAFVTALDPTLATLVDSTFLGGSGNDSATGIAADAANSSYVAGVTDSNNFPSLNAAQATGAGNTDAFVTKLAPVIPAIALAINPTTFSEAAGTGAATGTVTLNTVSASPVVVALASSDTTKATVPATVTVPANATTATFAINAIDNNIVDGDKTVNISATSAGYTSALQTVTVTDNDVPTLTLSAAPATFSEAAGATAAAGTVTRNTSTTSSLVVNLASTNTAKATVPATVTIPVGAVSATFPIAAVDNTIVDGTTGVTITAGATGYTGDTANVSVTDNDVPTLTLTTTPTTFSEGDGPNAATGTVVRNTSTVGALTVNLSSSDTTKATVPATVTIPNGAAAATFPIAAVDNNVVDGDKSVTLTVTKAGYVTGTAAVTVTDNDTPQLALSVTPTTFSEGAGTNAATATVSRNTDTSAPLTVALQTSAPTRTQIPAAVTIPARASAVTFKIAAIDDHVADGPHTVTFTVSAAGLASATASVVVTNNNTPALSLSISPGTFSEDEQDPVVGTLTRNTPTTAPLVVTLTSSNPAKATVPTTVSIPAGATSVNFQVTPRDNNLADGPADVTITAVATGLAAASQTVTVTNVHGPTLTLAISPTTFSEAAGAGAATGVVTRNTSTAAPLTVFLSSDTPGKTTVPTAVMIPSGAASASFPLTAIDDGLALGDFIVLIQATAPGFNTASQPITVTDNEVPTLTLTIVPGVFSEKAGAKAALGTVTRNTSTTTDLQISLTSSNPSQAAVPENITIPAGATTATFWVAAIDDMSVDGAQTVTITATAQLGAANAVAQRGTVTTRQSTTFVPGTAVVTVLNADVVLPTPVPLPTVTPQPTPTPVVLPPLTLSITPVAIKANAGVHAAIGTVTRQDRDKATKLKLPLAIQLTSSDPTRIQVPATVTIPAKADTATFYVSAVNIGTAIGTAAVTVTASHPLFRSGAATLRVIASDKPGPTPLPTATPTPRPGPTPTPRPTATPTPLPTATPTPLPTATPTPTPTATPTPKPGATPTPKPGVTPTPRATPTPRPGPTPTPRATPTPRPGVTPTPSPTPGANSPLIAWGFNGFGQVGDGTTVNRAQPQPVARAGVISTVAAGGSHTLAIRSDGTLLAWGFNQYGELGDGTTTNRTRPVSVGGLTNVRAIDAGWYHSLALKSDGTVWAWGYNGRGQIGDGTTTDRHSPVQVVGLNHVIAIAAGVYHNIALRDDGTVWTWGDNQFGQLGDGTTNQRHVPTLVPGLTGVKSITAGASHTLVALSDGTVRAWGSNQFGQLGDGTNNDSSTPVQTRGLSGVSTVAAGYVHSLALIGGQVRAWGSNQYGQLGDGTKNDSNVPVAARGLSGVRALAVGTGHNIALRSDGTVWAWGWNGFGQLGDGTHRDNPLPRAVPGVAGIKAIAAGYAHSIALSATIVRGVADAASSPAPGFSRGAASAQFDSVQLFFARHLEAATASDADSYTVTVNGRSIPVESAAYTASNECVTLALPAGALRAGDAVSVRWHNLQQVHDSIELNGETGPLVAR